MADLISAVFTPDNVALGKYEQAKTELTIISPDAERLIGIIEAESSDVERRTAFVETSAREIAAGADYSKVENMEQLEEKSGELIKM